MSTGTAMYSRGLVRAQVLESGPHCQTVRVCIHAKGNRHPGDATLLAANWCPTLREAARTIGVNAEEHAR